MCKMFNLKKVFTICTKVCKLPIESRFTHKITLHRHFRTGEKSFTNKENKFAHGVLESNEKCKVFRREQIAAVVVDHQKCTDVDFNQDWSQLTLDNILEQLALMGFYCKRNGILISDERFDKFIDICTERCFDFTDKQLIKALQILTQHPPAESYRSRNFVELWNALNDVCVERIDTWSYDQILYVCDHWHMLNLGKFNSFNIRGSLKVGRKLRNLPPHQLIQIMFYINLMRKPVVEMFEFETNLSKSLDDFKLNEIAVMCMGFFKTETKIRTPELVASIYDRLISEIDTVQDIPLTCILKTLRHSSNITHAVLIRQFLEAVNSQIHRLTALSCLHVALLGTRIHICDRSCIEQIVSRYADDVKSIRIKDFERITYVMGLFDFESDNKIEDELCRKILDELKNRADEIAKYPKCLSLSLHYLTMKGHCDEELLNVALSKKFVTLAYGNQFKYGKELFALDGYTKINLRESYKGSQLTEKNRQYMGKMMRQYVPNRSGEFKLSTTDSLLLEIKEASEVLCTHCYFAHALPHFDRPDIIIAYDKSTNAGIDIAHNFPKLYTGTIIDRSMLINGLDMDTSNVEIVNIIIGGINNYIRDTQKLNGFIKLKVEQSKIVGFRPIVIPWFDWTRLLPEERNHYVKHKITSALQQK